MSSQQKRRFGLPWGTDRAPDGDATSATTLDPDNTDPTSGVDSDDLGEGPFGFAGSSPTPTTDEAPASPDVPEGTAEAATMDTQELTESLTETEETATDAEDASAGTWPEVDRRGGSRRADDRERPAPIIVVRDVPYAPPPRREKPLVAGLVKAMREAAIASRDETMSRLRSEAGARVEGIRTRATAESAELRKRADLDITEIREWSKTEIARVRQQTEDRIESRKTELAGETERHGESVERLVSDVQSVVERFKADMDGFFERLLSEDDPARLAALAEQAPDAPDLSGDGPAALDMVLSIDSQAPDSLEADAAAAAEVAASEGLDMGENPAWPGAMSASHHEDAPNPVDPETGATRLLVTGLGSVAGISALKGALAQIEGVNSVSVSSGERGEFVFAITHEPDTNLAMGIEGLPGFNARITDATDAGISVVAHEPAA
jgi:hypothetical protein